MDSQTLGAASAGGRLTAVTEPLGECVPLGLWKMAKGPPLSFCFLSKAVERSVGSQKKAGAGSLSANGTPSIWAPELDAGPRNRQAATSHRSTRRMNRGQQKEELDSKQGRPPPKWVSFLLAPLSNNPRKRLRQKTKTKQQMFSALCHTP